MRNYEHEYYIIKSKGMAVTISYLLGGKPFYTMDSNEEGKQIYSFKYDAEFQAMLDLVRSIRRQHNKYR